MIMMMTSNFPKNIKKWEMSLSLVVLGLRDLGSTANELSGQCNAISFIPSNKWMSLLTVHCIYEASKKVLSLLVRGTRNSSDELIKWKIGRPQNKTHKNCQALKSYCHLLQMRGKKATKAEIQTANSERKTAFAATTRQVHNVHHICANIM